MPPPLSASEGKTGLTPREIIAATPRRSNWAGSSAATARTQGAPAAACNSRLTARSRAGSRPGTAGSNSSSSEPACQVVQAANERQEELLARLAQLRLPGAEGGGKRASPTPVLAMPPAAAAEPPAPAPAPVKAGQGAEPRPNQPAAASSVSSAVRQILSPDSAGARLGALAAEAAASRAGHCGLPFVQVHSALELQRMGEVLPDAGKDWLGWAGGGGGAHMCTDTGEVGWLRAAQRVWQAGQGLGGQVQGAAAEGCLAGGWPG